MWGPLFCVIAFSAPLVASMLPVLVLLAAACVARPWALPSLLLLVGACSACGVCPFARVPPSGPSARVASFSSPRMHCAFVVAPMVLCWCCVVLLLCVGCRLSTPVPWLWSSWVAGVWCVGLVCRCRGCGAVAWCLRVGGLWCVSLVRRCGGCGALVWCLLQWVNHPCCGPIRLWCGRLVVNISKIAEQGFTWHRACCRPGQVELAEGTIMIQFGAPGPQDTYMQAPWFRRSAHLDAFPQRHTRILSCNTVYGVVNAPNPHRIHLLL